MGAKIEGAGTSRMVIEGVKELLHGFPRLISSAGTDASRLAALQTDIQNKTSALIAAVMVGTPTAPANAPPISAATAREEAHKATATPTA